MSDTTQAIRDALRAGPTPGPRQCYSESIDPEWHIVTNATRLRILANVHIEPGNAMEAANAQLMVACYPEALTALLAELDAARASIEVATLVERERCAALCDLIGSLGTVTDGGRLALQWGAKRIREEVKS